MDPGVVTENWQLLNLHFVAISELSSELEDSIHSVLRLVQELESELTSMNSIRLDNMRSQHLLEEISSRNLNEELA